MVIRLHGNVCHTDSNIVRKWKFESSDVEAVQIPC
jgi:hypothetical protein